MQVPVVEPSWFERQVRLEPRSAMADHLHGTVLFDPQLADYHVVDATVHVCPRVRFTPPWENKGGLDMFFELF